MKYLYRMEKNIHDEKIYRIKKNYNNFFVAI